MRSSLTNQFQCPQPEIRQPNQSQHFRPFEWMTIWGGSNTQGLIELADKEKNWNLVVVLIVKSSNDLEDFVGRRREKREEEEESTSRER